MSVNGSITVLPMNANDSPIVVREREFSDGVLIVTRVAHDFTFPF